MSEQSKAGEITKPKIAEITRAVAGAMKKQVDPIGEDVKYVRQQVDKINSRLEEMEKRITAMEKKCAQ